MRKNIRYQRVVAKLDMSLFGCLPAAILSTHLNWKELFYFLRICINIRTYYWETLIACPLKICNSRNFTFDADNAV